MGGGFGGRGLVCCVDWCVWIGMRRNGKRGYSYLVSSLLFCLFVGIECGVLAVYRRR